MNYIEFDKSKKYDLILVGRIAVDLNPVDYNCRRFACEYRGRTCETGQKVRIFRPCFGRPVRYVRNRFF